MSPTREDLPEPLTPVTTVRTLAPDERKTEIARIMGGDSITPLLLENAQQLIDEAKNSQITEK